MAPFTGPRAFRGDSGEPHESIKQDEMRNIDIFINYVPFGEFMNFSLGGDGQ